MNKGDKVTLPEEPTLGSIVRVWSDSFERYRVFARTEEDYYGWGEVKLSQDYSWPGILAMGEVEIIHVEEKNNGSR